MANTVSLDRFLDSLGIADPDLHKCVWMVFVGEKQTMLQAVQARACLGWVADVQEGRMSFDDFKPKLQELIAAVGGGDFAPSPEDLTSVAKCMISGSPRPELI